MNKGKTMYQKNMWYKVVVAMMALVVLVMIMPLTVSAGNETTGKLGNNDGITWTYDAETKTLTLTGEDSGLNGEWDDSCDDFGGYVSKLEGIANGEFRHIVLEKCTIKGSTEYMFARLSEVESISFKNVDTSNVTNMSGMFYYCYNLIELDLGNIDTSNVTDMQSMFCECQRLIELDVSGFDTSKVTDMYRMFDNCKRLTELDVSGFNTGNVIDMSNMFARCIKLAQLDVSHFNTSNVTDMHSMFFGCMSLRELDLRSFDTGNVTDMGSMFSKCSSLSELNLSSFETDNVREMWLMFRDCSSLSELDLSSFKLRYVGTEQMLEYCYNLERLYTPAYMSATSIALYDTFMDSKKNKTYILTADFCNDILTRVIDVEGISLSDTSVTLTVADSCLLTATITPEDASIKEVSWSVSDETVATVSGGLIQAKAPGEVIITATSTDNQDVFATCTVTVVEKNIFADVPFDKWYYKFVKEAYDKGIMAGTGKTEDGLIKVDPEGKITREQFVQIMYNLEGKPAVSIENKFPDVKNEWYKNAVLWANANDIANGKGDGNFGVTESISRQDLALMLYKYARLNDYDLTANTGEINKYADGNKVSNYAKTAMDWAITKGIMSGKGNKGEDISTFKLDPTGTATRAECAAMLKNFMETYGE